MQCESIHLARTTMTTLHFTTTTPSPPTRITFPTRPTAKPGLTIKTRATINDGYTKAAAETEMSFYELLGIQETTTLLEIKQAYKQLARIYHPDVSPPDRVREYTERFIRVQEAYETLSDPRRRVVYDRDLSRGFHLAFNGRNNVHSFDQEMEDKSDWKTRWQSQLSGLKNRSMNKDERASMTWGARMRRQRNESS
ncbi:hypothetical protein KSS87_018165 [Heliosperma pusillum]|nr:hypothetical protein KSS87_018165 [Heliosperma pusillum]